METITEYLNLFTGIVSALAGFAVMLFIFFWLLSKLWNLIANHIDVLWMVVEFGYHKAEFKEFMQNKERHPKVKKYLEKKGKLPHECKPEFVYNEDGTTVIECELCKHVFKSNR